MNELMILILGCVSALNIWSIHLIHRQVEHLLNDIEILAKHSCMNYHLIQEHLGEHDE